MGWLSKAVFKSCNPLSNKLDLNHIESKNVKFALEIITDDIEKKGSKLNILWDTHLESMGSKTKSEKEKSLLVILERIPER